MNFLSFSFVPCLFQLAETVSVSGLNSIVGWCLGFEFLGFGASCRVILHSLILSLIGLFASFARGTVLAFGLSLFFLQVGVEVLVDQVILCLSH